MLSDKLIVIDASHLQELAKLIVGEMKGIIALESEKEELLDVSELSEKLGYGDQFWRNKINQGLVGEKDFNGKCYATYKQAYNFLFNSDNHL